MDAGGRERGRERRGRKRERERGGEVREGEKKRKDIEESEKQRGAEKEEEWEGARWKNRGGKEDRDGGIGRVGEKEGGSRVQQGKEGVATEGMEGDRTKC